MNKLIISSEAIRQRAIHVLSQLPLDPVQEVVIREHKKNRSIIQNDKMWAMLTEISSQVVWHGNRLSPEEWKDVLTAAVKRQKVVPGIDGGFVVLGTSTSKMLVSEMSELIECIYAFGTQQGVKWKYYFDE